MLWKTKAEIRKLHNSTLEFIKNGPTKFLESIKKKFMQVRIGIKEIENKKS